MICPRIVAVGGPIGVGKSSVAASLVTLLSSNSSVVGVRLIRSDALRKQMIGADVQVRLPSKYYNDVYYRLVYNVIHEVAEVALSLGDIVVIDATYARKRERDALACSIAGIASIDNFLGFWLDADLNERLDRLAKREHDASDAGPEYASRQQIEPPHGEAGWQRVSTNNLSLHEVVEKVRSIIETVCLRRECKDK